MVKQKYLLSIGKWLNKKELNNKYIEIESILTEDLKRHRLNVKITGITYPEWVERDWVYVKDVESKNGEITR